MENNNTDKIDNNSEKIIKEVITRKISFKSQVLRDLLTMASHYHFDKSLKQDELISTMIEELVEYYYKNKFIAEIKR